MNFFIMIPPPPKSTLFPYTTLFRSSARPLLGPMRAPLARFSTPGTAEFTLVMVVAILALLVRSMRSVGGRVGTESRSRWETYHSRKISDRPLLGPMRAPLARFSTPGTAEFTLVMVVAILALLVRSMKFLRVSQHAPKARTWERALSRRFSARPLLGPMRAPLARFSTPGTAEFTLVMVVAILALLVRSM